MEIKNGQKSTEIFKCIFCDYFTYRKSHYDRHLLTAKHLRKSKEIKKDNISKYICECSKEYKSNSGLWKHKKICTFINQENINININNNRNDISNHYTKNDDVACDNYNKIMNKLLRDNDQFKSLLVEQQRQIGELIPKIGNNNTHNVNHKINIQIFLNNYCKNALDIDDFTKSIQVSLEQLTFTKDNGLIHGLTNTIMENINKLNLYERPLHCTDLKRETLYIKDGTGWNKTDSREKLKSAINKISAKQYGTLKTWMDENPDFNTNEAKQQFVANVLSTIGSDISQIDDKIIKKLCNGTYIKDSFE